jgi:phospholipase C
VRGPNGFYRHFTGKAGKPVVEVRGAGTGLDIVNHGTARALVKVANRYTHRETTVSVRPGATHQHRTPTVHGWYDLTVTAAGLERRYAGHLENGRESISDPAMGGLA